MAAIRSASEIFNKMGEIAAAGMTAAAITVMAGTAIHAGLQKTNVNTLEEAMQQRSPFLPMKLLGSPSGVSMGDVCLYFLEDRAVMEARSRRQVVRKGSEFFITSPGSSVTVTAPEIMTCVNRDLKKQQVGVYFIMGVGILWMGFAGLIQYRRRNGPPAVRRAPGPA